MKELEKSLKKINSEKQLKATKMLKHFDKKQEKIEKDKQEMMEKC